MRRPPTAQPFPYTTLFRSKKDPTAAVSEPVTPITWWIENTTPHELREPIRQAVLEWNKPFEAAGFKNAVVVNRSEEHTSELQSRLHLVCRLLLEKTILVWI